MLPVTVNTSSENVLIRYLDELLGKHTSTNDDQYCQKNSNTVESLHQWNEAGLNADIRYLNFLCLLSLAAALPQGRIHNIVVSRCSDIHEIR
jgi:hypothetical protein